MGSAYISLTYPPNIDPTRATLAFGNWAPGRFKRELEDDCVRVRQLSLYALSQYLHDPQNVAAIINVGVMVSLKQLMQDSDETCRKVAADCVRVMNTHAIGRQACVKHGLLETLEDLLTDDDDECRVTAHQAIDNLCQSVEGCLAIIETKSLLPAIASVLDGDLETVKPLALKSLSKILMSDVGPAHDQILDSGILDSLLQLIGHQDPMMRLHVLDATASLTFSRKAKVEICKSSYTYTLLIQLIVEEIIADNWKARSKAALALANICMFAETKKNAIEHGAVKVLFLVIHDTVSEVRSNVLSAITRLAEHPIGRSESLMHLDSVKSLLDDPVPGVRKQAELALKIITWRP